MTGTAHAMVRRYRVGTGSIDELMRTVEDTFVAQLRSPQPSPDAPVRIAELGIVNYQALDLGDRTVMTITVFATEDHLLRAQEAAGSIRRSLAAFDVEEIDTVSGSVRVAWPDGSGLH